MSTEYIWTYAPETDMSFLLKENYDGEEITDTTVIGFVYGHYEGIPEHELEYFMENPSVKAVY